VEPIQLTLSWLQIEWLIRYVYANPFSVLTLIVSTIGLTALYSKLSAEHIIILKKLGLVPIDKLTEDEQKGIVVSRGQLRREFEEHRSLMAQEFVSVDRCRDLHSKTEQMFSEIMHHNKQHRKEDL
jgi:hypothetical protein